MNTINPVIEIPYIVFIAIVCLSATFYVYLTVGRGLSYGKRYLLLILRICALVLLIALLLQPSRREKEPIRESRDKAIIAAIDSSKSMRQKDVEQASRIDTAKSILFNSPLAQELQKDQPSVLLYDFAQSAKRLLPEQLASLEANGRTTLFHTSISEILAEQEYRAQKLVLLTDGHDWQRQSPLWTAQLARSYGVSIFAIPLGSQGHVRDISVQAVHYPPYTYVGQKFRLEATIHVTGCEHEDIVIELKRQGQVVESKVINANTLREIDVDFEREEMATGQFEYEVVARPLLEETDLTNNSLTSYIQTIEQQIKVLLLEGQPYWDTTFLQRFLLANDKIACNAFIQYSPSKIRRIGSDAPKPLEIPSSVEEFRQYDVVLLGKSIAGLLPEKHLQSLESYVKNHGGSVVFTRGNAYRETFSQKNNFLSPVLWSASGNDEVYLKISGEAPFRSVFRDSIQQQKSLLVSRRATGQKSLVVPWATTVDNKKNTNTGIVYRPYGRGHVVSIGVEGLWRWAFNHKADKEYNLFTDFWEQLLLWLVMNSDFIPGKERSFKMSTTHLFLGEKLYFQYNTRSRQESSQPLIEITDPQGKKTMLSMTARDGVRGYFVSDYLPYIEGKYTAREVSSENALHFIVYNDQPEEREVFVDRDFLAALCNNSGGKIIAAEELGKLLQSHNFAEKREKLRLTSTWDSILVVYCLCILLACDWFFRRKWGLC